MSPFLVVLCIYSSAQHGHPSRVGSTVMIAAHFVCAAFSTASSPVPLSVELVRKDVTSRLHARCQLNLRKWRSGRSGFNSTVQDPGH